MNNHKAVLFKDSVCRKLFSDAEKNNLQPIFLKGAGCKNKGYWVPVPNKPNTIRIFTQSCVITCVKIDPNKGPFW